MKLKIARKHNRPPRSTRSTVLLIGAGWGLFRAQEMKDFTQTCTRKPVDYYYMHFIIIYDVNITDYIKITTRRV